MKKFSDFSGYTLADLKRLPEKDFEAYLLAATKFMKRHLYKKNSEKQIENQDIIGEIIIKIIESEPSEKFHVNQFVFLNMKNKLISANRKRQTEQKYASRQLQTEPKYEMDTDGLLEYALAKLDKFENKTQLHIYRLFTFEEMSIKEIIDFTGMSNGKVNTALRKVREYLHEKQ